MRSSPGRDSNLQPPNCKSGTLRTATSAPEYGSLHFIEVSVDCIFVKVMHDGSSQLLTDINTVVARVLLLTGLLNCS